ncbi:hypothetical protein FE391_40670 [Nonomuraea sp. KC401]|uniref:hypothetical protein n=1 Tax=unclassified Nonomuraea TaxID=2593643 RepID=UPI0010FCE8C1|nr:MULTISPECIES: hypothetical protein [unclassified Nonomuraea]NBE99326.1 hypothetical protein [Nonomuraea sp. K271]TLF55474.1 hypothetical protein FE391_40670 [Nonomuraea sp. KC401]
MSRRSASTCSRATTSGSTLACSVPSHGTFFAVTGFATLPLLFMSNAFVPLSAMPAWMPA